MGSLIKRLAAVLASIWSVVATVAQWICGNFSGSSIAAIISAAAAVFSAIAANNSYEAALQQTKASAIAADNAYEAAQQQTKATFTSILYSRQIELVAAFLDAAEVAGGGSRLDIPFAFEARSSRSKGSGPSIRQDRRGSLQNE
jgi:hypothetical protein